MQGLQWIVFHIINMVNDKVVNSWMINCNISRKKHRAKQGSNGSQSNLEEKGDLITFKDDFSSKTDSTFLHQ